MDEKHKENQENPEDQSPENLEDRTQNPEKAEAEDRNDLNPGAKDETASAKDSELRTQNSESQAELEPEKCALGVPSDARNGVRGRDSALGDPTVSGIADRVGCPAALGEITCDL